MYELFLTDKCDEPNREHYHIGYYFICGASHVDLRFAACLSSDRDSYFRPIRAFLNDFQPRARERRMNGRVEILLSDNENELWILYPVQPLTRQQPPSALT